jgi:hypothetical protein
MPRARDGRLARLTIQGTCAASAAHLADHSPSAWNTVRAVVRDGLLRAGIDPECAPALRQGGATAQLTDLDIRLREEPAEDDRDGLAAVFTARIRDIARRFEDGHQPDFASASLAELLAWCLYRRDPCDR